MEELKNCEMNETDVESVVGGQTTDPSGAHWQPVNVAMGKPFLMHGRNGNQLWYRVNTGDTLGGICARFGVSIADVMTRNKNTITNANKIYAGDGLFLRMAGPAEENYGFYR